MIDTKKSVCKRILNGLFLMALLCYLSCQKVKTGHSWRLDLLKQGTFSSPRAADLNGDGILDIVLGAGKNEGERSEYGVVAVDGLTGQEMWKYPCFNQMVGSANFYDINQDGTTDILIGGRNKQLFALNGKNGELIWEYEVASEEFNRYGYARFNFYNPQLIPDQNADGLKEVLVANGGNVHASIGDESRRFPGVLLVLDGANGKILALDTMPDGKETYMSPVVADFNGNGELEVVFGSGGETINGHLYRASLKSLLQSNIQGATILAADDGHGFFAPPVIADINADRIPDIIANSHGGKTIAINGKNNELIWEYLATGMEASNSIAPGFFNEDDTPDFFTYFCKGKWPENKGVQQVLINGKTGEVLFTDSIGSSGFSTPLAVDLNGDGRDEALLSIIEYDVERKNYREVQHHIRAFDFSRDTSWNFTPIISCKNIASTPWVGDTDGDGNLDIVYCQLANHPRLTEFFGLTINKLATSVPLTVTPSWGAYMGNDYDGIFKGRGAFLAKKEK